MGFYSRTLSHCISSPSYIPDKENPIIPQALFPSAAGSSESPVKEWMSQPQPSAPPAISAMVGHLSQPPAAMERFEPAQMEPAQMEPSETEAEACSGPEVDLEPPAPGLSRTMSRL